MLEKSLVDYAYDILAGRQEPVVFKELWNQVVIDAGLEEEEAARRVAQFYTNLSLDGRFVTLTDNNWDLRSRHPFSQVHIDMNEVYSDEDEETSVDAETELEGVSEDGAMIGDDYDDSDEESEY